MSILIDSATVASPGDSNCDSTQLIGQCFQVQNNAQLSFLSIPMHTNGSPTGSFTFSIYAITGTYGSTAIPTGTALATSDSFSVASLTASYVTYQVNFSGANQINMLVGQQYAWVCNYNNTAFPNAVYFQNKTPSFHGGNQVYYALGLWNALATYDMVFDLEGTTITNFPVSLVNTIVKTA
jgi:hypothetical protein